MAPRKRRGKGRLKGQPTSPHGANTHGFATLADEIYLEILFYIPSVPIPTSIDSESYPDIRRSRHETLLSLSQTSRSLRRFFWRYLWQRIEVREGMKIWDEDGTLTNTPYLSESGHAKEHKNYATELVRQLEIVTIRNPQLAQYVNYLDMLIGGYSIATVLTELARCLALFPNLHTVQIDVCLGLRQQSKLDKRFERTFKKYSYPQIRNVFISFYSVSFIASCPQARRVGLTGRWMIPRSCLQIMMDKCPHLEVLDLPELRTSNDCKFVVDSFPNLRTIVMMSPLGLKYPSHIDILKKLNHLQTFVINWNPLGLICYMWHLSPEEQHARAERAKEDWIESVERVLIQIQLRDNLEKTLVVRDSRDNSERRILLKPP